MRAHLRLASGGEAEIVELEGERLTLSSTIPSPPGSTLEGSLDDGNVIRVKVRGCRKEESGRFRIEGRAVDLTRAVRERLSSAPSAK